MFGTLSKIPYQSNYEYQCTHCGIKEQVPVSAIEMIGFLVDRDDSTLPTFACQCCEGTIVPTKYPYDQDHIMLSGIFAPDFEIGGMPGEVCACCGVPL